MGMAMSWRMLAEGKTGIATKRPTTSGPRRGRFPQSPRYPDSDRDGQRGLATPIDLPFSALGTARGYDAR